MSCGNPHATDCREVIEKVYIYLDGEAQHDDRQRIRTHLEECGPCLREFGLEEAVRSIVRRSCHDRAPADLRQKVLWRIEAARVGVRGTSEIS